MRIPDQILEEISRRVDIVELVGRYVSLRQSGSKYMGLCPFHTEKTPSFSVDPQLGLYYCFGCHQGGGSFKFVMEIEGLSFREAVAQLGEEVGVAVLEIRFIQGRPAVEEKLPVHPHTGD